MPLDTARGKLAVHAETAPDFVHVVFIKTTAQKLWDALTDGKSVRAWWANTHMDSDFKPGSKLAFRRAGGVDVEGEILEADPTSRLVYTFHVTGPGPQHDEGATLVTYTIEPNGPVMKLTVTHSNLKKDGRVQAAVSRGWTMILSSLKTLLETGEPLMFPEWSSK